MFFKNETFNFAARSLCLEGVEDKKQKERKHVGYIWK